MNGWNQFQSGVLDKIPVVLIGGKKFTAPPGRRTRRCGRNDGLVALQSALADIGDPVLAHRRCFTFDDIHSIFVSNAARPGLETALTLGPRRSRRGGTRPSRTRLGPRRREPGRLPVITRRLPAAAAVMLLLAGCGSGTTGNRATSTAVVIVSGLASTTPSPPPRPGAPPAGGGRHRHRLCARTCWARATPFTPRRRRRAGARCTTRSAPGVRHLPDHAAGDHDHRHHGQHRPRREHLARFLDRLHRQGVQEVDLVGHSMGGLYARAAIRALAEIGSPVKVRSLIAIGTPWQGLYLADHADGTVPLDDCLGDAMCESQMTGYARDIAAAFASGSARELSQAYLMGIGAGTSGRPVRIADIPVVLIAGKPVHQARRGQPGGVAQRRDRRCAAALAATSRTRSCPAALLHLRRHPQRLRIDGRAVAADHLADLRSAGARGSGRGWSQVTRQAGGTQPGRLLAEPDGHRRGPDQRRRRRAGFSTRADTGARPARR